MPAAIRFWCPRCNARVELPTEAGKTKAACPKCKREIKVPAESVFFNQEGVTVTASRVVIRDQTFPLSGLSSVKVEPDETERNKVLTRCFWLAVAVSIPTFGLALVPGFIWAYRRWKSTPQGSTLILVTAAGEAKALTGESRYVSNVRGAIEEAIAARG